MPSYDEQIRGDREAVRIQEAMRLSKTKEETPVNWVFPWDFDNTMWVQFMCDADEGFMPKEIDGRLYYVVPADRHCGLLLRKADRSDWERVPS